MNFDIAKNINVCWEEYGRLCVLKEYYAAFLRVANVFECLRSLSSEERVVQERRLNEIILDDTALKVIGKDFENQERRIVRVLSIGEQWNDDEWLLVITIRVQNDLLREYLLYRGLTLPEAESIQATQLLKMLSITGSNRKAFSKALHLARRNWGLPVQHKIFNQ